MAETYESLANGELEAFRLGLIHGRMTAAEKDAVMDRFRRGEIQVLVSTSVVEVGVDVPNATLMTIEGGHRFGLAQLHQLRGRISRGKFPGLLLRLRRSADRGIARAAEGVRGLDRRFRAGRDGFQAPRAGRHFRHASSTACRRCGSPTCCATRPLLEEARRDAQTLVAADPGLASRRTCQAAADDDRAVREGAGVGRRGVNRGEWRGRAFEAVRQRIRHTPRAVFLRRHTECAGYS